MVTSRLKKTDNCHSVKMAIYLNMNMPAGSRRSLLDARVYRWTFCGERLSTPGTARDTPSNTAHLNRIKITYPFHPLGGQTVTIVQKMPCNGVDGWHVRADDGRGFRIEHWMTRLHWERLSLTDAPLIAPGALLQLCRRLDSIALQLADGHSTNRATTQPTTTGSRECSSPAGDGACHRSAH